MKVSEPMNENVWMNEWMNNWKRLDAGWMKMKEWIKMGKEWMNKKLRGEWK